MLFRSLIAARMEAGGAKKKKPAGKAKAAKAEASAANGTSAKANKKPKAAGRQTPGKGANEAT